MFSGCRPSILDLDGQDGEEAARGASRQHGQVPLCSRRQPRAHAALAEKQQAFPPGGPHGRVQGRTNSRKSNFLLPPSTLSSLLLLLLKEYQAPFLPSLSFHPFSTLHWSNGKRADRGSEGRVSGVKLELLIRAPPLTGILCRASRCNLKWFFAPNNQKPKTWT